MRTTLNLSDALMSEVKDRARKEGVTMTSYLEEALRERLRRADHEPSVSPLPTFGIPGEQAFLVDIDDKDALDEALHEPLR